MSRFAGQLTIEVIRAEGLTGVMESKVVIRQGESLGMTQGAEGPAPTFDTRYSTFRFDIDDESQPILFSLVDSEKDVSIMDT